MSQPKLVTGSRRSCMALPDRLATIDARLGLAGLVFATVFGLYALTLAPGVVGGDAGEHQLAVPLLGIPHTTGYPLYILAGKLWTLLLPAGTLAWRVNLFSALGGALAAAMTALVVYHLAGRPTRPSTAWPGAVVAGLTLAWGLTLWQWSTIAGVRSFNVFFFALLTLLAFVWAGQQRRGATQAADRTLAWLALTVGLSLAHHRTTIFYLPSLALWVVYHQPGLLRRFRRLLGLALLTLLPLTLYLFIYLRGVNDPPYTHEQISDWQSFWFLVGSGDSQGLFFSVDPAYLPGRLQFIGQDILRQLSWPGVGLALLGAGLLLWRRPAHWLMMALLVGLLLAFTLDFEVVNLNEAPTWYLMPAYFVFAVWVGVGVNGILDLRLTIGDWRSKGDELRLVSGHALTAHPDDLRLRRPDRPLVRFVASALATAGFLALLAYTLAWPNWQTQVAISTAPLDDWRQLLRGDQAQRLVESSLPQVDPHSIIWGDWEQYTPFKYYQLINGWRPDVTVRNPLNQWPEKVAAARAAGQSIYLTRKPADLIGTPYLSMVGPLIYLGRQPNFEPPPDLTRTDINFEDELELIGYQARVWPQQTPGGMRAGPILQLTLYWRVPHTVSWDYALSLRLLDPGGHEVYKRDALHPVLSSYPTTLWTAGEVVADFYELPLSPAGAPLALHVLPYRTEGPGQWYNLTQTGAAPPRPGVVLGPFP